VARVPEGVVAAGHRTARTARHRTVDRDVTPGAGRRRVVDRGSAGARMVERIALATIGTVPATISRMVDRPTVPMIATGRPGPTIVTARRVPARTIATVRASPASRPVLAARTPIAVRGSATVPHTPPGRPGHRGRSSSPPHHRSSRSRRTRSSLRAGVRSRRRSSPAAMPNACSSPPSAATRWNSSCSMPRACASRSRRSRAAR
jgi:hypothetical protein